MYVLTLASNSEGLAISLVSALCMTMPTKARENLQRGAFYYTYVHYIKLSLPNCIDTLILTCNSIFTVMLMTWKLPLFQVLIKIFPGSKCVFPHLNLAAIIDGIAQLCQCHVKFIHPGKFSLINFEALNKNIITMIFIFILSLWSLYYSCNTPYQHI